MTTLGLKKLAKKGVSVLPITCTIAWLGVALIASGMGTLKKFEQEAPTNIHWSQIAESTKFDRKPYMIPSLKQENASFLQDLRMIDVTKQSSTGTSSSVAAPLFIPSFKVTHFFSHIPKAGGYYALSSLEKLLQTKFKRKQYKICNHGVSPIEKFSPGPKKQPCHMWMSEYPYSDIPQNTYIIVRDPRQHTLSQFFHCTESDAHAKAIAQGKTSREKPMTHNLTHWLHAWVKASNQDRPQVGSLNMYENMFSCYTPVNFQSRWMGFDPAVARGDNAKQELRQRFKVIGDMAEMDKSICLIFIRYTGWVPDACACNAVEQPVEQQMLSRSHGVKHHGAQYNTSAYEDELIQKLREIDNELYYQYVKDIFEEQVKEVEQEFGVHLCEKIRDLSSAEKGNDATKKPPTANVHNNSRPILFHFIHSNGNTSLPKLAARRVIESAFYHHPNARVTIYVPHDNPISVGVFQDVIDLGYHLAIKALDLESMIQSFARHQPIEIQMHVRKYLAKMPDFKGRNKQAWLYDWSDLARLLILYEEGGVYLDLDMLLLKPIDKLKNTVAFQRRDKERSDAVNNAVLIFEPRNDFVYRCLATFFYQCKSTFDNFGINGPSLITKVLTQNFTKCAKQQKEGTRCPVQVLGRNTFYPIDYRLKAKDFLHNPEDVSLNTP